MGGVWFRAAAAACVVPLTACTLWYILDNPYAGIAAGDSGDAGGPILVQPGVGAIATYGDTLYANVSGNVYVWNASSHTLAPIIEVYDADYAGASGLAVAAAGIAWTSVKMTPDGSAPGIYFQAFDGGIPAHEAIADGLAALLVMDGRRVSYTALVDAGTVVRTCRDVTTGCDVFAAGAGDGGSLPPISLLVDAGGQVQNVALAALPGEVAWVNAAHTVNVTGIDSGVITQITSQGIKNLTSPANASVATDGTSLYVAFENMQTEAAQHESDMKTYLAPGAPRVYPNLCLATGAGLVAMCSDEATVYVYPADGSEAGVPIFVPVGSFSVTNVAITSTALFMLDSANNLYWMSR